jgi:hypothetical protein
MNDAGMAERVEAIRGRIVAACEGAGRDPAAVRMVAVSKKQSPQVVAEAAACGVRVFGENRVQEAAAKIPLCPDGLSWHLVGHLQGNKVRAAVEYFDLIHSVDDEKLLRRIDGAAAEAGRTVAVLLQVNVAEEAGKSGMTAEALPGVLRASTACLHVDVMGLMAMPPFTPDPADAAPHFRRLRELRDRVQQESGIPLPELSMGMSGDFEVAIAEGATWVRIGTALLGARKGL